MTKKPNRNNKEDSAPVVAIPEAEAKSQVGSVEEVAVEYDFRWIFIGVAILLLVGIGVVANLVGNSVNDGIVTSSADIYSNLEIDNGDAKINWNNYGTYDIELSGTYTISSPGTYHFTGSIDDGMIVVNATDVPVRIILDNVSIKNSSGPAIACYAAEDLVIELVGNNYLEDGTSYSSDYNEDVDGVIYSQDDLSFTGNGTLTINANHGDGIVSKDDLKFNSGTYTIASADDAIRGKDSVYIVDGDFIINSGADAIKSTNDTDYTKGFVLIENGTFAINAGAKGVKATNTMLIYGGTYNITSKDDAIHTNGYIGIVDGNFTIDSSDDGMHADSILVIDGGDINIEKSYEGLEAQQITVNNGTISIVASDDGMNAGGGADSSATNRAGAGAFDVDENCILTINGGSVYVNSAGDGIDSNGALYFNGGTVVVDGPTNNGNGALDTGSAIVMNGGEVIAVGASGMAETLGQTSSVNNISVYLSTTASAGTKIEIKDSAGNTVLSHTSVKTFNHIAAGTSAFKEGEMYTIYLNGKEATSLTISGIVTTAGNSNSNFNNMNMQRGVR